MPITDPRRFLRQMALFSDFNEEELEEIASFAAEIHVLRGRSIFERGSPCLGFHSVLYGQVKLGFVSAQGQEKIVEILGPGQSFGEAVMFMDRPHVVNATALEDCMLLHVEKAGIFALLERKPVLARRMLAGISRRLHGLIADVEAYTLHTGGQRVVGYLLKDGPQTGERLTLTVSKRSIASRLNITPEYFSRVLHELTVRQLIRVEGRAIDILDAAGLRAYEG